jgi:hypothetical protein
LHNYDGGHSLCIEAKKAANKNLSTLAIKLKNRSDIPLAQSSGLRNSSTIERFPDHKRRRSLYRRLFCLLSAGF